MLCSFLSSYLVNDVLQLHAYVCFGIRRHQRRAWTAGAQGIHLVFIGVRVEIRAGLHEGREVEAWGLVRVVGLRLPVVTCF